MNLTEDDIREFRAIWLAEFEEDLTEVEARVRAHSLLELYACLAEPLPVQSPSRNDLAPNSNEVLHLSAEIE